MSAGFRLRHLSTEYKLSLDDTAMKIWIKFRLLAASVHNIPKIKQYAKADIGNFSQQKQLPLSKIPAVKLNSPVLAWNSLMRTVCQQMFQHQALMQSIDITFIGFLCIAVRESFFSGTELSILWAATRRTTTPSSCSASPPFQQQRK